MRLLRSILKHTRWALGWIANGLFIVLYLIALSSPHLSPEVSAIPALVNMAFPLLLIALVLFSLLHIGARNWKWVGLYLLLWVVSWGYIRNYYPLRIGPFGTERDLRVMSYNVAGFDHHKGEEHSPQRIILNYDPDVVCLQEGTLSYNSSKNKARLKATFGERYPHRKVYHNPVNGSEGIALLSKYPITRSHAIPYPSKGNGSMAFLLTLPTQQTLMVVNNHMESYSLSQKERKEYGKVLHEASVKKTTSLLRRVHSRLGAPLEMRAAAAVRVAQVVDSLTAEWQPSYVVVAGDLNDTPMSYTYHRLRGQLRDAYRDSGGGIDASFNDNFYYFRIDHLFYSGPMRAVKSSLPWLKKSSDHNPLIVDFVYNTP